MGLSLEVTDTSVPEACALNNPAQARQGAVWGGARCVCATVLYHFRRAGGTRSQTSVFQEILFPYRHAVLLKESPILLLKGHPLMVLFLPFDIVYYHILVAYAIRDSGIFVPPSVPVWKSEIFSQPFASKSLDGLYILCHRECGGQRDKNMNMVRHPSNPIYLSFQVLRLTEDNTIQLSLMFDVDSLLAPVCTEDEMVYGLDVTHCIMLF